MIVPVPAWRAPAVVAALAASLSLGVSSCTNAVPWSQPEPVRTAKVVVVLVDQSKSAAAGRGVYAKAVRMIFDRLEPGDRFIMGAITGRSGQDFGDSVDETLPLSIAPLGPLDEPRAHEKQVKAQQEELAAVRQRLETSVTAMLGAAPTAAKTTIIEALRVVAQMLRGEQRRKRLVILSDMVEDSDLLNLERTAPTEQLAEREVERHRKSGVLPALDGVTVHVVGAVASPPGLAAGVEAFWRRYLTLAGADLDGGQYASVLMDFAK